MNNARGSTRAYWCEVIAEGPANGMWVPITLGTCQTISPKLALRWLRGQARRIADGLDPSPGSSWIKGRVLVCISSQLADASVELRRWCADAESQRTAQQQIRDGSPLTFTTADHTGRYSLTVWPVDIPAPSLSSDCGQPASTRREHARHRKTWRKSGWLISRSAR
ncbi:hypothetical protein SAMN05428954_4344 [Streptomyces sp. 2112.3]|nr:hypothetical protein BX261_2911 [Streptomyces sp. 2321.6]SEC79699.1 hypothetical protein SAMN05428940_2914 [Streptomyces sp. 2133.1]SEE88647.1 hypothetical protein SAMN05428954_4344 [Streptomyces sp. 2112.3]